MLEMYARLNSVKERREVKVINNLNMFQLHFFIWLEQDMQRFTISTMLK